MITSSSYSHHISFKSDKKALGGAAFQPKHEAIKSMEEHHASPDKVLRLNPLQNFGLGVKKVLVDIPGSIGRGLQGDKTVSFHEFLQMALVPYYLGGAMLYNSFRQGGDHNGIAKKQGVGILLYYAGMGLADNLIDGFVKHKYAIDLDLKYKNEKGEIRKVFESVDFTRWDLLTDKDWEKIGDRLGIPRDIPDRDTTIKAEIHKIQVRARAWKLVLGATFAATGVGLISKHDCWKSLGANSKALATTFKGIFNNKNGVKLATRLGDFKTQLWGQVKGLGSKFAQSFKAMPAVTIGKFPMGKVAIGAIIALPIIALWNLMASPNRKRVYLSKQEAMPYASQIAKDDQLRNQIKSQINPNKTDFEELYSKLATTPAAPAAPISTQVAQNSTPTSPFDAFEAFLRGGVV